MTVAIQPGRDVARGQEGTAVMPPSRMEDSPSVDLPGRGVMYTSVVDILPLSPETQIRATRRVYELPSTLPDEDYQKALTREAEFLRKQPDSPQPELTDGGDAVAAHAAFVQANAGKVGLRDLSFASQTAGVLEAKFCVVPFPAYKMFNNSPDTSLRSFGAVVGVAAAMITEDGYMVIQHRRPFVQKDGKGTGNRIYGDVPGVSVAGLLDAPSSKMGTDSFDMVAVGRKHLLGEATEETGVEGGMSMTFIGILRDRVADHHELAYIMKTPLTSDKLIEAAKSNLFEDTGVSFKENLVLIKCTPENIEKLLCDVQSPFPPTHAPPYLLVGHALVKEALGVLAADRWLERVKNEMVANYDRINRLCPNGKYDPNINATAQGLPSFKEALSGAFQRESLMWVNVVS